MGRPIKFLRLALTILFLCAWPTAVLSAAPALEDCDRRVRDAPRDHEAYDCFLDSVRATGQFDDASRRLEALLQIDADRYQATLALAVIESFRAAARAETLFLDAAEAAADNDDAEGCVRARAGLGSFLARRGRLDEADTQLELALRVAEEFEDPELLAATLTQVAFQAKRRSDYGRARSMFQRAESVAFPDGSPNLQSSVLNGLGGVCVRLGQHRQAMDYYLRQADLDRQRGDLRGEASARYNVALASEKLNRRGLADQRETERLTLEALDIAIKAKHSRVEARTRLLLGKMLRGAAAIEQFDEALRLGARIDHAQIQDWARREIAREKIRQGPEHQEEGFRLFQEAIDRARKAGDRDDEATGLRSRAFRAAIAGRPREQWIAWYLEAFDAAERLRDLQPESGVRARTFIRWIPAYISLSGFLLDRLDDSPTPFEDLELAFLTVERMRSRMLLDMLDAAGARVFDAQSSALHDTRDQLLQRLSETQRALMKPSLSDEQRSDALAELERLESDEAAARDRLAREDPVFGRLRAPAIPTLQALQQALAPDQAILAFHLGNRVDARDYPAGGRFSWVIRVIRDEARAIALPDKSVLEQQVGVFQGLFERRDGSEAAASSRLYEELLQEAISGLPESITRLVIIPDGVLYRLPFSALRSERSAPPLVASYSISYSPSATLWMRWKDRNTPPQANPALVLADPEPLTGEVVSRLRTAVPWTDGLQLGRLPHARDEADALIRALGAGVLRTGVEASESYLKQADLGSFGLVHFAAHAVLDDGHPDRSAVVLAPGSEDEDGLLQVREIVDLDLTGRVVVLSACRSASGALLEGEGVMSLAHAFFQAGAHTVVGSLWPLRDAEAAVLLSRISEQLARGQSVGEALATAQSELIAEGQPAAAWAGLVVLGDGDQVPVPGGRTVLSKRSLTWTLAIGVLALLLATLFRPVSGWIRQR